MSDLITQDPLWLPTVSLIRLCLCRLIGVDYLHELLRGYIFPQNVAMVYIGKFGFLVISQS